MDEKRHSPRERMVFSAAQLIRRHGVAATGLRDVVAHAHAPRGSIGHYFPGGKDQLVAEAARWGGDYAAKRIARFVAGLDHPTPSGLFAAMVAQWRDEFAAEGYAPGCPVAASVTESAAGNETVRSAAADGFAAWRDAVADALRAMTVPAGRATTLATLMISTLEGAILMSRAAQDPQPLSIAESELAHLLDAASMPTP